MPYKIAGIDVHKKVLAVVVSDVEIDGEYQFEGRLFGSSPEQLRSLAGWLLEQEAEEVVMESTAQYWRPVWEALERYWKPRRQRREGAGPMSGMLHLAQAQSNRGPRGRKKDFPDAERLVKRLVAQELTLSFVPDAEQYQTTREAIWDVVCDVTPSGAFRFDGCQDLHRCTARGCSGVASWPGQCDRRSRPFSLVAAWPCATRSCPSPA